MSITKSSNPQILEIPVSGPGEANRLFIFTGSVDVNLQGTGSEWRRETLKIEINHPFAAALYQKGIGIASLGGISNKNEAVNAGWAIESVSVARDSVTNKPVLTAQIAVRDNDGLLETVAYEVFVLAKIKTISV